MTRLLGSRWIARCLAGRRAASPKHARRSIRLGLEPLECRLTPTTHIYNPVDTAGLISALEGASVGPSTDTSIINLQPGTTYTLTAVNNFWYGPTGLPPINTNVTIHGNGATIARDSNPADNTPAFRLFYVSAGMELTPGSLTMDNVTLEGGFAKGGDSLVGGGGMGAGGAIFNQGVINLTDVTLDNNIASGGSSGVTATNSYAGGGMGGNASDSTAGGFGGSIGGGIGNSFGGLGGDGGAGGGGGGGGFITGSDGLNAPVGGVQGQGGGLGGFGAGGDGGSGGANITGIGGTGGIGGAFGFGGSIGDGGGGGGVGGGGGGANDRTMDNIGPGGGFGGGGGAGFDGPIGSGIKGSGGIGGFGGGGGGEVGAGTGGFGGFGGGNGGVGDINNQPSGGGGAGMGGAIFNMGADNLGPSGQATLTNCTLTNNGAAGGNTTNGGAGHSYGGAIFNLDGSLRLNSDTLAANYVIGPSGTTSAGLNEGDAVYNLAYGNEINFGDPVTATLTMNNSILAADGSASFHTLVSQAINGNGTNTATVTGSHNLVTSSSGSINPGVIVQTADPNLGTLQNNGGLTPTMQPSSGSPVLGAGDPTVAPAFDQRGVPRPPNGPTDLGSVQVSVSPTGMTKPSPSPSPSSSPPPSLFQAILGLYIAEVEKDIHFGNSEALQDAINFNAQFTEIFGINIAPLIEQLADANVQAALSGSGS